MRVEEKIKQLGYEPEAWATTFGANDLDFGRRVAEIIGEDLLYVPSRKTYYVWNGKCFAPDDGMTFVEEMVRPIIEHWLLLVSRISDAEARKYWLTGVKQYLGIVKMRAAISGMRTMHSVALTADDLDHNALLLNAQNGTIVIDKNLRHLTLKPHDRTDKITMVAGGGYYPALSWEDSRIDGGVFKTFIERTLPDPTVRKFIQRALGASLIGGNREQMLLYLHDNGDGQTGKTTLGRAIEGALGEYFGMMDFSAFTKTTFKAHADSARPSLIKVRGKRVVWSSETEKEVIIAEGMVKNLTGGETQTGRQLYGTQESWRNTWTPWLVSNTLPLMDSEDGAYWRRVHLIEFTQRVLEADLNKDLQEQLATESRDAVMMWMLEGLEAYLRKGLKAPSAIEEHTQSVRNEMSALAVFFEDRLEWGDGFVTTQEIFDAYNSWCILKNVRPKVSTVREMGRKLGSDKRFTYTRLDHAKPRGWAGAKLK